MRRALLPLLYCDDNPKSVLTTMWPSGAGKAANTLGPIIWVDFSLIDVASIGDSPISDHVFHLKQCFSRNIKEGLQ